MYGLSVEEKKLYLTKSRNEDAVETIAIFVVPFGSSQSDVLKLAEEMVDVLNRDLENRALDIANNPPGFTDQGPELPNASDRCDNPDCNVCCPAVYLNEKEPDMPDNWKPLSQRRDDWPIDPETGTPKVDMAGEVIDFPEPGVAHPAGCLCQECDPPIKDVEDTEDAT